MNEITFPNAAPATVAIVAVAAGAWVQTEPAYFVNEAVPSISFFRSTSAEVINEEFAREIASVFAALSDAQEPLGAEFEAVWDANEESLYES